MVECPACRGDGGCKDYFGEWSQCELCGETGAVTSERAEEWHARMAALDPEIDRMMAADERPRGDT